MALSDQQLQNMKKRKERIIEAATHLFATEGYEGTTIKNISIAANVSFGSIFTYFKNKEELFYHVVVKPLEGLSNQILNFDENSNEPLIELKKMISDHINIFSNINHYLQLVVQIVGQHERFSYVFEPLDKFHIEFRDKISRLVQNGQEKGILEAQDPLIVATLYTSLLIGLRLNTTDHKNSDVWRKFASSALNIFGPIYK